MELDEKTYGQIEALSDAGTALFENEDVARALDAFEKAFGLVPDPKTDWEAGIWLSTAIGDCHFLMDNFHKALEYFQNVAATPDGADNPFVQLRLGQCLFESGQEDEAKARLKAAFDLEGESIFEGEDLKYAEAAGVSAEGV